MRIIIELGPDYDPDWPSLVGLFLLFSFTREHKTKETSPLNQVSPLHIIRPLEVVDKEQKKTQHTQSVILTIASSQTNCAR